MYFIQHEICQKFLLRTVITRTLICYRKTHVLFICIARIVSSFMCENVDINFDRITNQSILKTCCTHLKNKNTYTIHDGLPLIMDFILGYLSTLN